MTEGLPARVAELRTPALVVDLDVLDANVTAMGRRWPGSSLRTHVKAFKSTAMARHVAARGHPTFCCATVREVEGLARAGLGEDLLLANEVVVAAEARRLRELDARVTVAVDSPESVAALGAAGPLEVLVDVDVGLPRCGCAPEDAGWIADLARRAGHPVRGVMGYEGHLMVVGDRRERAEGVERSLGLLARAHEVVGGDVVSGGGTGTWDLNTGITELQAGSYTLMDTAYAGLGLPFGQAAAVIGTVLSRSTRKGYAVADVGLKALGMDHGDPSIDGARVWFCSDEHLTFAPEHGPLPAVGAKVAVWPAHIDPTVAYHEQLWVARPSADEPLEEASVLDRWPVDLRGW